VAAGFLPGTYSRAAGKFEVRAVDAHSWVEVYFSGIGWVSFDPTPPRSLPSAVAGAPFPSERSATVAAALGAPLRRSPTGSAGAGGGSATNRAGDAYLAVIAAAIAGVLALLALVAWLAGHVRLRRSLDGDAELATRELARALRRLGYAIPATVTLAQIERRVRVQGGTDAVRYVQLLRERRYAASTGAAVTLRDRRRLRLALTAHLGLDVRLRGLWALPPSTVGWRIGTGAGFGAGDDHPGGP
jgi:hypothetical protein